MIRAGVIGVGVHGMHHVRLLSAMTDTELVGIYDADQAHAAEVADQFGVTAFDSIPALLSEVDAVSVVAPTSRHYDVVMQCFAGGRHVLVEKPIAATVAQADEMIAEASTRGLVLAVGHIERFNPAYRAIAGHDVHPLFIESHRLSVFNPRGTDVAVVLDLMIHDIDIVLDLVGRPVLSVSAAGVSVVSDEVDIANARIEFEGGCVANLTASRISQKVMRKVRTFQRNSYVSMDFHSGESEVFSLDPEARPEAAPGVTPQFMAGIDYRKYPNDGGNALELELNDFLAAVRNGVSPKVTGANGREALRVAALVMDSMAEKLKSI